jgi:predicted alpha/beta-hydrolase family hydrolase
LYPGASAGRDQPSLVKLDAAVSALTGWSVIRAEFAYRTAGRRAPDKRVVVGGRSMGGRICSMVAGGADGQPPPTNVVGVATIAYPLHPPGRPDRLRVEHMPAVSVPWLFVSGTRDPFGTPDEFARWTKTVGGPVAEHWIDNRGHDLKGADTEVASVVSGWLAALGS